MWKYQKIFKHFYTFHGGYLINNIDERKHWSYIASWTMTVTDATNLYITIEFNEDLNAQIIFSEWTICFFYLVEQYIRFGH